MNQLGTSRMNQLGTSRMNQLGTSWMNQLGTSRMNQLGTSRMNQLGTSRMNQLGTSRMNQAGISWRYIRAYRCAPVKRGSARHLDLIVAAESHQPFLRHYGKDDFLATAEVASGLDPFQMIKRHHRVV
jgi:hypothetical protein